jgi:HTH-type transcriptional repressor of NAD biosynthesis genes
MAAIVPTKGHAALIDFALNFVGPTGRVFVYVQGKTTEPVLPSSRAHALQDHYRAHDNVTIITDVNNTAPQNPDPLKEKEPGADTLFWNYWTYMVCQHGHVEPGDYLVASEPYGEVLARYMGCCFIPFDIERNINPARGTDVRECILEDSRYILPEFIPYLQTNIVMFGQESVGKSTIGRMLAEMYTDAIYVHEFAREYLEQTKLELNSQVMRTIAVGQAALMRTAISQKRLINIFDTDLLSTIGYHRIHQGKYGYTSYLDRMYHQFPHIVRPTYFVLPDDIPVTPDPLRYGGTERESTYEFWIHLLESYGCTYIEVPAGLDMTGKLRFIKQEIDKQRWSRFHEISSFVRE